MNGIEQIKETRRRNLSLLVREHGKHELARRLDMSPDYLYQMSKATGRNKRNVSDQNARRIEDACNKPRGWLDKANDETFPDPEPALSQRHYKQDIQRNSSDARQSHSNHIVQERTPELFTIAPGPPPKRKLPKEIPYFSLGEPESQPELVYVAMIRNAQLSAGGGKLDIEHEHVQHSHAFRADYMRSRMLRPEKCTVWKIRGDSMVPRYNDGDVVLIDGSDTTPRHGKVFALAGEDGMRVKQLRKDPNGHWHMHSFNPDQWSYPPEPVTEDIKIIGRVRWHAGDDD